MKIKIYQVNMERDDKQVAFFGLDQFPKFQGSAEVNSSIYDLVFSGDVDCNSLEAVYHKFNHNHPAGYKARSLSVSDVVEIVSDNHVKQGFYFCDSFGFKEVSFEPDKTQKSENFCNLYEVETISVLLVQPNQVPEDD